MTETVWPPIEWLNTPFAQQRFEEIVKVLRLMTGATSLLEVGSCFGQTLLLMSTVLSPGAKIRVIDLGILPPEADQYQGYDLKPHLNSVRDKLRNGGFDIEVLYGDSRDPLSVAFASESAPYDVIFIDGCHDYEAVKQDWGNYGSLGKKVLFHDIADRSPRGVGRLWQDIKLQYETEDIISTPMGIGVVHRE